MASIFAVLLINFAVLLFIPAPGNHVMNEKEVEATLQGHPPVTVSVNLRGSPPPGVEAQFVRRALTEYLRMSPSQIRVVWLENTIGMNVDSPLTEIHSGLGYDNVRTRIPFKVAIRQADGRWLVVKPRQSFLSAWSGRLIVSLLLSAALLAPLAWLTARRLTRPVRALADAAAQAQLWPANHEIALSGPIEIRSAAIAINEMRERLQGELADRSRMLVAMAHDLRNPLTSLRLRAESVREPGRTRMIMDMDRMMAMINQVLEFARGQEIDEDPKRIDAVELVRDCSEEARVGEQSVELGDMPKEAFVVVQPESIRRAYENLIENALRYGGGARLSVRAKPSSVSLIVEDSGPGIPEAEMARLTKPFERLEASRSRDTGGVGLGLSIARDVALRNGGVLLLKNRAEGGLNAEIHLPTAKAALAAE